MKFCHIYPTAYLDKGFQKYDHGELLLAHLVESDEEYSKFYSRAEFGMKFEDWGPNWRPRDGRILDNSAFELYRAGLPMFDGNKMIDLGRRVGAEYLVLPDYPGEHPVDTIEAAIDFAPKFKEAGFKTFFVPQGRVGRLDDYIRSFAYAATSDLVDYIGISIIAGPNAFDADQPGSIQTFLSRITLCQELESKGLLTLAKYNGKKIHFLGMTDGPKEILWATSLGKNFIDTWDSSAAVWAGIEGVRFDDTPTGLLNGKVKTHVDFNRPYDEDREQDILYNINVIDKYVTAYNNRFQSQKDY